MDLTHLTNLLFSQNDNLEASVEPSGIQIYGEMPEEIWENSIKLAFMLCVIQFSVRQY